MKLLIEAGADPKKTNSWGCGLTHWIAMSRLDKDNTVANDDAKEVDHAKSVLAVCDYLKDELGLDFSLPQKEGHTAAHKAAMRGLKTVVQWFISRKPKQKADDESSKCFSVEEWMKIGITDNAGRKPSDLAREAKENEIEKLLIEICCSFNEFELWDFPGNMEAMDSLDFSTIFSHSTGIIFVVDAQDDFSNAVRRICIMIARAHKINPQISYEIFIHKVDELNDDHKLETKRDIHQRITDDLAEFQLENVHTSFHLTSIYDNSIFEAFSLVIQKLIAQLPTLENLLNVLCSNSGLEKAFVFDVLSKIYIATDSSPVDIQSYELCSDMIDVVLDISSLYVESQKEKAKKIPPGVIGSFQPKWKGFAKTTDTHRPVENNDSYSVIKLNTMVLYLKQLNSHLALVCLVRAANFSKQGLLDYNFRCFKDAFLKVRDLARYGIISEHAREESGANESISELAGSPITTQSSSTTHPEWVSTSIPLRNPSPDLMIAQGTTSFAQIPQQLNQLMQYQQYLQLQTQQQQFMQAYANQNPQFAQIHNHQLAQMQTHQQQQLAQLHYQQISDQQRVSRE
ncbi:hypothetical protein HK098_001593 [Nowakowskiella sp. JEL0407]|nr:hypothetical protein HK098_001593 [Nowakowskiella sp. JEL0407]